jgi:hypothetical protein
MEVSKHHAFGYRIFPLHPFSSTSRYRFRTIERSLAHLLAKTSVIGKFVQAYTIVICASQGEVDPIRAKNTLLFSSVTSPIEVF